jgi:integrase/recombinase XerD
VNQTVSLTKRVTTASGSRYCPVVQSANGRVRPDYVIVNDKPEHHPEGAYYISWYVGKTLKRKSVGTDANAAAARQHKQESILIARNAGATVVEASNGRLLVNEAADYLSEIEAQKKQSTFNAYQLSLKYFQESCSKQTLEEITRIDLLNFQTFLRDQKHLSPRTVSNVFKNTLFFLKARGILPTKLLNKTDRPVYTKEMPEVFEPDELSKFFSACDDREKLVFEFFLMTGMREQEVMHATWKALDFKNNTISVRYNPEFHWSPKAYKEREIPAPQRLLDSLKKWKEKQQCDLIFPMTGGCKVRYNFWRECRKIAERAGLDPKNFWLHKFRATFATMHLRTGVDLVTLQSWMGHTDVASTMRYLQPAKGQAVRDKVEATFQL